MFGGYFFSSMMMPVLGVLIFQHTEDRHHMIYPKIQQDIKIMKISVNSFESRPI